MKTIYKTVYIIGVFALGWAVNERYGISHIAKNCLHKFRFEPKRKQCKQFSYFFRVREENKKVEKTIEKLFTLFTLFTGKTEAQPC